MQNSPETPGFARRALAVEGLVVLLAASLLFAGLGAAPLWDDDETRFASVAREMLRSGDWVVPRYNGALADKPPLVFWVMAASFATFGENAAAARLGSAVFSVVALLALWWLAARMRGRAVGWCSVLVMATSLLFVAEARLATMDATLLALVTVILALAVGGWWDVGGRFRAVTGVLPPFSTMRGLAIGLIGGLGVLCKGPAALALPFGAMWLFVWTMRSAAVGEKEGFPIRGWRSFRSLRPLAVLAGALAATAPWHVALWQRSGDEWFRLFYGTHYLGRLTWLQPLTGFAMSPPEGHGGFPLFQAAAIIAGLFPWSVFLPLAAWRAFRGALRGAPAERAADALLSLWLLVWMLAVSVSSTQLPHYAFPVYPAACVMIASLIMGGIRFPSALPNGWLYAACAGLLAGGAIISAGVLFAADFSGLHVLRGFWWLGLIPVAGALLAGASVALGRRGLAAGVFVCGAVAMLAGVFFVAAPRLGKLDPVPAMIMRADELAGGRAEVGSFRFTVPGLVWSAGRPVEICRSAGEAAEFLLSSPRSAVVLVEAEAYGDLAVAMRGKAEIVAEGQPLVRRGKVLLVRAR